MNPYGVREAPAAARDADGKPLHVGDEVLEISTGDIGIVTSLSIDKLYATWRHADGRADPFLDGRELSLFYDEARLRAAPSAALYDPDDTTMFELE